MNDAPDLMTLQDIADAHRCSVRHARDVIVRTPGFPDEAPTSSPRNRLWITAEVRAFITRQRAPAARRARNTTGRTMASAGAAA